MGKLIDADELLKQPIDTAHYPSNFVKHAPTVEAIPKDKVKQAREEIDDLYRYYDSDYYSGNKDSMFKCSEVLEIIDKLIEGEDKDA